MIYQLPESLRKKLEAQATDGFMSGAETLWNILVEEGVDFNESRLSAHVDRMQSHDKNIDYALGHCVDLEFEKAAAAVTGYYEAKLSQKNALLNEAKQLLFCRTWHDDECSDSEELFKEGETCECGAIAVQGFLKRSR